MNKNHLRMAVEKEKKIISIMVKMYCKGQKHTRENKELCKQCEELLEYANQRIERCPRKEEKTFCNTCPIHCYKPEYRNQMKAVMRYSGPRLLYKHPLIALRHGINTMLHKLNQ